jgi:structural maintenance of chromosome 4
VGAAATERDAALKVVGTIKHVEVDIQAKLDDFKLAADENKGKMKHWEKELGKLRKEQATVHGAGGDPVRRCRLTLSNLR